LTAQDVRPQLLGQGLGVGEAVKMGLGGDHGCRVIKGGVRGEGGRREGAESLRLGPERLDCGDL
jgi:hypothetical protein